MILTLLIYLFETHYTNFKLLPMRSQGLFLIYSIGVIVTTIVSM